MIKIEPDDPSVLEEKRCERIILPRRHRTLSSADIGKSVLVKSESVSSRLEKGREYGVKEEEEANNPSQEIEADVVSWQVTVCVDGEELLEEETLSRKAVVDEKEDADLGDGGCGTSPLLQLKDYQMQSLVKHPISLAETVPSENTSPFTSLPELIANGNDFIQLSRSSQQLNHLPYERPRNSDCISSNDRLQTGNKLFTRLENKCGYSENVKKLEVEKRTYTHEKSYKCEICGKCFSSKGKCKKHKIIHIDKKPFKCQICKMSFNSKQSYQRHEKLHTGEKCFECQFCGKSFNNEQNYGRHERIHAGEKPFKCQFCEKSYISRQGCKNHEMIHSGEKPFKCQFCEKSYISIQGCKNHEMIHTGEKPFKCQFCDQSFINRRGCKNHEMTHTGEKPFKCQFCKKSFNSNPNHQRHEKIHTGEKPFKCQFCVKSFACLSTCKSHENTHTNPSSVSSVRRHFNILNVNHKTPLIVIINDTPFLYSAFCQR